MPYLNRTVADYAQALRESQGRVTQAAKLLNVTRTAIYRAIERHPSLREILDDVREEIFDAAQIVFKKMILEGDWRAVERALDSCGSHRGYARKQEHNVTLRIIDESE